MQKVTLDVSLSTVCITKRILKAGLWMKKIQQIHSKDVGNGFAITRASLRVLDNGIQRVFNYSINVHPAGDMICMAVTFLPCEQASRWWDVL